MRMVNKKGESGHPCLVPLCSVKLCYVIPLVGTVADRAVYKIWIWSLNAFLKPNFGNVENRKDQFTLSKAFLSLG